ncbi:stage II sporulation protein D [Evansella sp. AB-P1]|uniref:stage II sporulation protein D n=1 Tax=Evansella sp. AB-P1 TaxID=3037653 RepID=UPI00241DD495|nr:stage II sporulation protein D [Evansella sp. AB-P1]MDG5787290.1 stage II sporulation protein D [Evansella sp. AB-P1]
MVILMWRGVLVMKGVVGVGLILVTLILVIPSVLVVGFSNDEAGLTSYDSSEKAPSLLKGDGAGMLDEDEAVVRVFRSETETVEEVNFEDYIVGVVAREMPATYEVEALKAQALTARTYIIQMMTSGSDIQIPSGADITDTVQHQVYSNEEELLERWGEEDFEWKLARVKQAVYETSGQVITYNGSPITATYFSTSNGYTENSEDYWQSEIPYLRSVESPWDVNSPRYLGEKTIEVSVFESILGVTLSGETVGQVVNRTPGGRVALVNIGGKEFTGREIRELLDLDSTDFSLTRRGNSVIIETRGWGHGVGMSQFGADGMAKDGYTYEDIIDHYYYNVKIEEVDQVLGAMMAAESVEESDGT